MTDEEYMQMAVGLAERGRGFVNPNPMVGAVIVKDGRIIGRGWHRKYGELHAERNALADCAENPAGATIYVTLEPCCHTGKTPPCTDAILAAGIRRVVIGAMDPNPLVGGRGAAILREHGVSVETGVLKKECEDQNRVFLHYIRTGLPYVVLKYAMTLDGKIATATGASQWITGEEARAQVHALRHELMGIMVGSGTVLADDPMLNCRLPGAKNPVRIICDARLRTPPDAMVVRTAKEQRTIIATVGSAEQASPQKAAGQQSEEMMRAQGKANGKRERKLQAYRDKGGEILELPVWDGHVDLRALMRELGRFGIDSILLEGGSSLNWSALSLGIVNEVQAYIAPKIFGGATAKSPVEGSGIALPDDAFGLEDVKTEIIGGDFLVRGRVRQAAEKKIPAGEPQIAGKQEASAKELQAARKQDASDEEPQTGGDICLPES